MMVTGRVGLQPPHLAVCCVPTTGAQSCRMPSRRPSARTFLGTQALDILDPKISIQSGRQETDPSPGLWRRTTIMKPLRRFTLADAMVLIAATAIAFAFVQFQGLPWILAEKWFPPHDKILRPPEDGDLAALISSFLIPWTVALCFLRFNRPQPSRRRLFMRPGFVACANRERDDGLSLPGRISSICLRL